MTPQRLFFDLSYLYQQVTNFLRSINSSIFTSVCMQMHLRKAIVQWFAVYAKVFACVDLHRRTHDEIDIPLSKAVLRPCHADVLSVEDLSKEQDARP